MFDAKPNIPIGNLQYKQATQAKRPVSWPWKAMNSLQTQTKVEPYKPHLRATAIPNVIAAAEESTCRYINEFASIVVCTELN